MKYLYHYHAIHQLPSGAIVNADGTLECGAMINSSESFVMARDEISKQMGYPKDRITICSLTLLNPH